MAGTSQEEAEEPMKQFQPQEGCCPALYRADWGEPAEDLEGKQTRLEGINRARTEPGTSSN